MTEVKSADLHTPEELLYSAESLLSSGRPQYMRSVILESLSALEAYVQRVVFPLLDEKLDPLLVKWLKERTKMDFDGRLQYLTPLALDTEVDVTSSLWREYKEARIIRNKVAHHSRVATMEEAKKVYETVKKWLSYLGSNAEVNKSLFDLKTYLETKIHNKQEFSERNAVEQVVSFYDKTSAAKSAHIQAPIKGRHADLILDFGLYKTLFEIKKSERRVDDSLAQLEGLYTDLLEPENYRFVVIIFTEKKIPRTVPDITKINDHTSVVYVKI